MTRTLAALVKLCLIVLAALVKLGLIVLAGVWYFHAKYDRATVDLLLLILLEVQEIRRKDE
jgi:hypothetical protein